MDVQATDAVQKCCVEYGEEMGAVFGRVVPALDAMSLCVEF